MCDYSLMAVPNRLAQEGEELMIHRFYTGSLGLASSAEMNRVACGTPAAGGFWSMLKQFFCLQAIDAVCAVCIPPGARLELCGLPIPMQRRLGVGPLEQVTFTQITASANAYRDAVRFRNGREVRLQELREGIRVR